MGELNDSCEYRGGKAFLSSSGRRPDVKHKAAFVEPMLLLPSSELPGGTAWLYELKLDGYRAIAFKSAGEVHLRSRNDNDFNRRYPAILKALRAIPDWPAAPYL